MSEPPRDRVQELFDRAVALPLPRARGVPGRRLRLDTGLRTEVESLLAYDAGSPKVAATWAC